ncbi:hypothetical protein, partial [Paraburkholderia sp. SIMBA_054]|uniref:hypothetical protein n=1 Tax=Paraburkholderia sp. SIMBA_054 TaxID=3085795 RepID=UPI00397E2EAE
RSCAIYVFWPFGKKTTVWKYGLTDPSNFTRQKHFNPRQTEVEKHNLNWMDATDRSVGCPTSEATVR